MSLLDHATNEELDLPSIIRGPETGANCVECPFSKMGRPNQPVVGEGSERPIWIIVGEGPGQNEVIYKRPFVGQSGKLVNEALARINVKRESVYITNATLCQPPSGATEHAKRQARACCAPRLKAELLQFPRRPILALGALAAQGFCGDKFSISAMAGTYHEVDLASTTWQPRDTYTKYDDLPSSDVRVVIPSTHPAAILRGGTGGGGGGAHTSDLGFWSLCYDAQKINLLARGVDLRFSPDIEIATTDPVQAEQLVEAFVRDARRRKIFACDTETYVDDPKRHSALQAAHAKLSAIGLAFPEPRKTEDGVVDPTDPPSRAISVAWRILTPRARRLIGAILADQAITKIFHNGLYDIPVLNRHGFVVGGPVEDTLLAHHSAFPGLAHNLQRVTAQFCAIPPWKCLRGDVKVLLPDRSTCAISEVVTKRVPEVLSLEEGKIVAKKVIGWHDVYVPGQKWLSIKTLRCDKKYNKGLIVTPDHKVMTQRGLVEARHLKPGIDTIAIDEEAFSADEISVAIGTLLGDSSLNVSRVFHKDPWKASRASVRGGHANEALRDCKVAALARGTSGQKIPAHTKFDGEKHYNAHDFFAYGTQWTFQYRELADLVYDSKWQRRIKSEGLQLLNQRGLAMMYMDDGDLRVRGKYVGAGFATNGFPKEDVELFAQWLRERYYGNVRVSDNCYTAVSASATRNMLEDLRGFIHPVVGYKTVHADTYKTVTHGIGAHFLQITAVDTVTSDRSTPKGRYQADHRYCITVEDTKLFYTNYGLVSNSEFRHGQGELTELLRYNALDTLATARIEAPLAIAIKRTNTEKTYEVDKAMARAAAIMHVRGVPIDRDTNEELRTGFKHHIDQARSELMTKAFDPGIFGRFTERLAFEQSRRIRKHDPLDLDERITKRVNEMGDSTNFKFMIDSGDHIVAFLRACGVPLSLQTAKGRISTKKDVLESFMNYPEVRALLLYRENAKLLSTFCERMFTRHYPNGKTAWGFCDDSNRVHPRWSVHKITGRWGSEGPQCFDGETEILTEQGWIRFDQLPRNLRVAQYHVNDQSIDFALPTDYIKKSYAGPMINLQGQAIDLLVTPNHRFPVRYRRRAAKQKWRDITADEWRADLHLPVAGKYRGGTWQPSNAWLSLLCAAQADGAWNGYGWDFSLSKPRKIDRLLKTLKQLKLKYTTRDKTEPNPFKPGVLRTRKRIYVLQSEIGSEIATRLGLDYKQPGKGQFDAWVLDLTATALDKFTSEVMFWDGCYGRDSQYASSEKTSADWVQIACVLTKRRAKVRGYNGSDLQTRTSWQVDATKRTRRNGSESWYITTSQAPRETVDWKGTVYCVSVPSSYIVVRRNGIAVVTGNCQNWPKADKKKGRPNLRTQVIAPHGRTLVAFDAKQLEARLIALKSGDPFLLDIFANDKDIHTEFAVLVWPDFHQKPVDERKVLRDLIKRPEYGSFYGGAIDTLWKSVVRDYPNVTIGMIGKMVAMMRTRMPGVAAWHSNEMRKAELEGQVTSMILKRRRCFPIRQFDLSEVVNFGIQSSGADLINLGLMDIMPRLPEDAFPILQIHDAVVFECDEDDQDIVKQLVIESFTRDVEYEGRTMHFPVDAKAGKSWAEVN